MKKRYIVVIAVLIAAGSFLAGSWVTYQGGRGKSTAERRILHYVDPMNPAFKSDKPGIAPCGMPLEPVYADQGDAAAGGADIRASLPPGAIRISPEKQQLIGVKTITVDKAPWSHTLRVLGRVAPDETRTYRINAAANGWIEEASPVTTGSLVKENDILATYYSLEYRNLVQNYFNLINIAKEGTPGEKAVTRTSRYSTGQLRQLREAAKAMGEAVTESSQIDYYRRNLYNYGMSPYQVDEMERTRTIPDFIEIRAPIGGFILYRNVSPGLRFDRGAEFFRIADLSRVWILADIFETEASYFKPRMRVAIELPYQRRTLTAEVSPVLPLFDPATRTLKVRLEADNPGYVMRPDMFVNVELPVSGPPAIIVPVDAVLDSGLKKTVFVDRGNGYFEPRQVKTGRLLGERVEIQAGLMTGEKIVVAGNFLIDSEARMQMAASGITGNIGRDLVCGMNIDEDRAKAEGNARDYKGKTYYFCSPECREDFGKDPERYLKSAPAAGAMPAADMQKAPKKPASHDHAAVPVPAGAKTAAPDGHAGMAMPGDKTGAMPAMPGDKTGAMPAMPPPRTRSEPGARGAASPGSAVPGQGGRSMPMPEGAMPGMTIQQAMPGSVPGEMPPPPPGSIPMPGAKAPEMSPPMAGAPGMDPGPPPGPGQPDPRREPQGSAPQPGVQPDEMAPGPAPAMRPPRVNLRNPRILPPGDEAPRTGMQQAAPRPGPTVRRIPPGSPIAPGAEPNAQPVPPAEGMAAPAPGASVGQTAPPVSGPPEEKR